MNRCLFVALALAAACGGTKESPRIEPEPSAAAEPEAAANDPSPTPPAPATVPPKGAPDASTPPTPAAFDPIANIGPVTKLKSGFSYVEGPTWRASTNELLFSDIPNSAIVRFEEPATFTTFRAPSGRANGLAVDKQGRLIACEGLNRRVTRTQSNGTIEVLADSYSGYVLNAPNDAIAHSDGSVYFTDPDYSIAGYKELSFNGVYRIAPDKTISLVADDLAKPNGIALSPDENVLYVTDESAGFLRAYDVAGNGSTSKPRKFAEVPNADGIAVDDFGNVYVSSTDSIVVLAPNGSSIGAIPVPQHPANCTFGGPTRSTLYITAGDSIYSVNLNVAGLP